MVTQLDVTVFFSAGHFLDLLECKITLLPKSPDHYNTILEDK